MLKQPHSLKIKEQLYRKQTLCHAVNEEVPTFRRLLSPMKKTNVADLYQVPNFVRE